MSPVGGSTPGPHRRNVAYDSSKGGIESVPQPVAASGSTWLLRQPRGMRFATRVQSRREPISDDEGP